MSRSKDYNTPTTYDQDLLMRFVHGIQARVISKIIKHVEVHGQPQRGVTRNWLSEVLGVRPATVHKIHKGGGQK